MAIKTLEVDVSDACKQTVGVFLAHLRQHCIDLHNHTRLASMMQKTQKETRYLEGHARAYSTIAEYIDGIILK
jgi:ribosomal protein S15P/S13E